MRVRDFTRRLQQYNVKDVFDILQFLDSCDLEPLLITLNLLEQ